ncbi:MAG: HAD-IA family hydrolase [Thermoanaerobaculia bacterium]
MFDLDGTLVDSRRDLAASVNAVRRELGLEPLPVERVVAFVGEGARKLVRRSLPETVDGAPFESAFERFLECYYHRCLEETRTYSGIEGLLDALAGRYPLAVLTNKPERHTRKILAGLGLCRWLRFAVGGDSLAARKPDPVPLLETARRLGAEPSRVLLVGDSSTDAETARNAGVPAVLVRWGFGRPEELDAFDAVLRPTHPREILSFLGAGGESPESGRDSPPGAGRRRQRL